MAESDEELLSIKTHSDNGENMLDEFEEAELLKYEEEATNVADTNKTTEISKNIYDDFHLSLEIPTFEDEIYEEDESSKSARKSVSEPREVNNVSKEATKADIVSNQGQVNKTFESSRQEKSKNISIKSTPYNDEEEKDDIDDDEDENKRRRSRFKSERTTEVVRKHKSDVIPDKLELNQKGKEELEKYNKNQKSNKHHNNWNRNNFSNSLLGQHSNSLLHHPSPFLNLIQHQVYLNNPPRPHISHPLQNPHHVTYRPHASKELYNMAGAAVNLMLKNSQSKQNMLQQPQHNLLQHQQNIQQKHPLQNFQQKQHLPMQPSHIGNIPSQLQPHAIPRQSPSHLPIQVRHPVTQQSFRTSEPAAIMRGRHNFPQPTPSNVLPLNQPQVPIYINQQPPQQNFQPPPLQHQPFPHLSQQQTLQRSEPMTFQQPQWNQSQQTNQQSSLFFPQTSLVASPPFKDQMIHSQLIDNNDFVGQPIQTVILNRSRDSGQHFRGRKKQETFNLPPQQQTPQTNTQQQPKAISKEEEEKAKQQIKMLERAKRFAKPPEVKASKHSQVQDNVEGAKKAKLEEEEEEQLMLGRRVIRKSQLAIQADLAQAAFNKTRSSLKDFELQKGLDEQKRLREVVMRRKEERRLMLAQKKLALIKAEGDASVSPQKIVTTTTLQKNALIQQLNNIVKNNNTNSNENNKNNDENIAYGKLADDDINEDDGDDVLKDMTSHRTVQFKRTVIANNKNLNNVNDNKMVENKAINETTTPTKKTPLISKSQQNTTTLSINKYNNNNKMVVVANLNHSNNTTQLKKFADLVGPLESMQFNSLKGKMLLKFQQANHAWLFCKAFNGKKIGSSVVTATLH